MRTEDTVLRALSDSTRRAIYEHLASGELPVKDITSHVPVSQPAVSQHLAELRDAGLVSVRKQGRLAFYSVTPGGLGPLVDWMAHYRAFWPERVERLKWLLERMDS